jgi:hypothetical protein
MAGQSMTLTSDQEKLDPLIEAMRSARYLVDGKGVKTDIIFSMTIWEKLIAWLEEREDRRLLEEWLPRLRLGPQKAGALRWQEVVGEWDDGESL